MGEEIGTQFSLMGRIVRQCWQVSWCGWRKADNQREQMKQPGCRERMQLRWEDCVNMETGGG